MSIKDMSTCMYSHYLLINKKIVMKKATLINNMTGERINVHATTEHPNSSYGQPVWVDDDNNAYMQVGVQNPFYTVIL